MTRSPEVDEDWSKAVERQAPSVVFLPIGILQLGSYLRANSNANINYLDLHRTMNEKKINVPAKFNKALKVEIENTIQKFKPDIVALSCTMNVYHAMFHYTANLFKEIAPDILIVGGGHYPSSYTQRVADDPNIDYVIVGEGELPFMDLIEAHNQGNLPKDKIINTKQYIGDFTKFPTLDYEEIEVEKYVYGLGLGVDEARSVTILSSRGCPNRCIYCATHNVWNYKFRARSAEQMLDEIEYLHKKHKITRFMFVEDNFILDKNRVKRFCELLIEKNIDIEWYPSSIQINSLDCEIIHYMAKAGCQKLNLAIETGTKRVQKLIRKNVDLDRVPEIVDCIKKEGMGCECLLIFGFPGETKEEMEETINYAQSLKCDWYQMGVATPLQGTAMYEVCEEMGYFPIHENDRINVFREGTITTPEFTKEESEQIMWDANYRLNFLENNNFVTGKYDKIQVYYESIAKRYPTHFICRYMLLQIYERTAQTEKVKQIIQELKKIYHENPEETDRLREKYNLKSPTPQ